MPPLPFPAGPFSVGVVDLETAASRTPGIFARIFYPTTRTSQPPKSLATWVPAPQTTYIAGYGDFLNVPAAVTIPLVYPFAAGVRLAAVMHAPLASEKRMPVVVFSHGLGGMRTTYSAVCAAMAAQGVVVAAMEHRDGSASVALREGARVRYRRPADVTKGLEGDRKEEALHKFRCEQVAFRVDEVVGTLDVLKALDEGQEVKNIARDSSGFDLSVFQGKLDFDNVAMVGHSFGGATVIQFMQEHRGYKIASTVALDAWMYTIDPSKPVLSPLLSINTETFNWKTNAQALLTILSHLSPSHPHLLSIIKGSAHQNCSDIPVIAPTLMRIVKMGGPGDPIEILEAQNRMVVEFLRQGWSGGVGERSPKKPEDLTEKGYKIGEVLFGESARAVLEAIK